jgi:hypothetical protein
MASEEFFVTGPDWVRGAEEPIESSGRPIETTSWDEVALDRRAEFDKSLRLSGLSEESVQEALAARDLSAAELIEAKKRLEPYKGISYAESPPDLIDARRYYEDRRRSALQMLGDWWNKRVVVVDFTEPRLVRVPLFVLGTPSAPNCEAKWTNEIVSGLSDGWEVQIAGSGFASDRGTSYVNSASFEALSGQTKLIYCDIPVQLEHIEIRQKKRPSVRQWRINLNSDPQMELAPGLLLLDPHAIPEEGKLAKTFPTAGDPSGSTATYTMGYTEERKETVTVGLDVKGVKLGLTAKSSFGSNIKIEYKLRTGLDYDLFYARDCDGYVFGSTSKPS